MFYFRVNAGYIAHKPWVDYKHSRDITSMFGTQPLGGMESVKGA